MSEQEKIMINVKWGYWDASGMWRPAHIPCKTPDEQWRENFGPRL